MAKLLDALQPYLRQALPDGTTFTEPKHGVLAATMPAAKPPLQKSVMWVFDEDVIKAVLPGGQNADETVAERVGNFICNRMGAKFAEWGTNNVQQKWRVGSESLDE
jgi:hypothetical protein